MQETFDFIVVDGGPSIDEISLKIIEMSDTVLVISILSLPCLTNVKRLLWTFQKLGFPPKDRVKVLVNRYHKKSLISSKRRRRASTRGSSGRFQTITRRPCPPSTRGRICRPSPPARRSAGASKNFRPSFRGGRHRRIEIRILE